MEKIYFETICLTSTYVSTEPLTEQERVCNVLRFFGGGGFEQYRRVNLKIFLHVNNGIMH